MNRLQRLYTAPLRWLEAGVNLFARNRHRIAMWARRPRIAAIITTINLVTVVVWLVIWSLAAEADSTLLTDQISDYWTRIQSAPEPGPKQEPEPGPSPVHDLADYEVPKIDDLQVEKPDGPVAETAAEPGR